MHYNKTQQNPNAVNILNSMWNSAQTKTSTWQWQTSIYGKYMVMLTTRLHANHSENYVQMFNYFIKKKQIYLHTYT